MHASMLVMERTDVAGGLARVVAYIRSHLSEPLDLCELAARASFSRFHFHRVFRAVAGEPLAAFIRRERLQRAALELRRGGDVGRIGLDAGYDTHSAFARAFKEHFGVTPSAFRNDRSLPVVPEHAMPRFRGHSMDVTVQEFPPRRLLALRHVGPYRNAGGAFAQLVQLAVQRGLLTPSTEFLGLSYDSPDDVDEEQLRFDACITSSAAPAEPLCEIVHDGGKHAVYRHVGPYQLIEHVFDRLFDAVVFSDIYVVRDAPCVEIYRNDPETVPPAELITDVCIPIH